MSMTAITSPELTPPVGPFSQAIEVGGFLYFSGQVAQDPATGKVVEGALWQRQSASSKTYRRFSRRPARVLMMSCALCVSHEHGLLRGVEWHLRQAFQSALSRRQPLARSPCGCALPSEPQGIPRRA